MEFNYEIFWPLQKSQDKKLCQKCEQVDENDLIKSDGYIVCTKCGTVVSERISDCAEWNNYTDSAGRSSNNSRCGSSVKTTDINPYTNELTSFMPKGVKNVCIKDGKIVRYDISKLHIQNTYNHRQKSFNIVETLLERITNDKYSKRVLITAKLLWAEIAKTKKVTRAGVRKGLIACCLYYACVHHDCTRSPMEICSDFNMKDTKQFNKGDKEFKQTFEVIPKWSHLLIKTSNSEDYFSRFCSNLEMDNIIREGTSFLLAKECREMYGDVKIKLRGLFPKSASSGIIYWVLRKKGNNVTKTKIAQSLGICSPTLSKTVKIIEEILGKPPIIMK